MRYEVISADCHVDLCWLPPDLFTKNASAAMRERMPYVENTPAGKGDIMCRPARSRQGPQS